MARIEKVINVSITDSYHSWFMNTCALQLTKMRCSTEVVFFSFMDAYLKKAVPWNWKQKGEREEKNSTKRQYVNNAKQKENVATQL